MIRGGLFLWEYGEKLHLRFWFFNLRKRQPLWGIFNLYLINLPGFPPHTLYGSTFFVTTLSPAITAPSPILTPAKIVTFVPIHTSFPIVIGPFDIAGWPDPSNLLNISEFLIPNGNVVTRSILWFPPKYIFNPDDTQQKLPIITFEWISGQTKCISASHQACQMENNRADSGARLFDGRTGLSGLPFCAWDWTYPFVDCSDSDRANWVRLCQGCLRACK